MSFRMSGWDSETHETDKDCDNCYTDGNNFSLAPPVRVTEIAVQEHYQRIGISYTWQPGGLSDISYYLELPR
jgi:hypothetical protein